MNSLRIRLLHRFQVRYIDEQLVIDGAKVQELFSFLILFRAKAHSREALADQLWRDAAAGHARRYLSKALWQLQNALDQVLHTDHRTILNIGPEWLQLSPEAELWTDISVLERAYGAVHGIPGPDLSWTHVKWLQATTHLYTGDLLEGWYHDWCLLERQRFRYMYLAILDRLTDYHEARNDFEAGIECAGQILHHDRERERTHRQLMRLFYLSGDRTAALQQYERCVDMLRRQLDVAPDEQTTELYNRIKAQQHIETLKTNQTVVARVQPDLGAVLENLLHIQAELEMTQHQVEEQINWLKQLTGAHTTGDGMVKEQ